LDFPVININTLRKQNQYIISIAFILLVATVCYLFAYLIGYKVAALILLVSVSLIAMFFDIQPVLLAALISALVWNFFFIPPKFTFHIDNAEDVLLFFMYFIIALLNAALTFKIRAVEKVANKKEEKEHTLKLYKTLLNSLSHELRTPISTIIAATDNLQSDSNRLSESNKTELISEISKASLRLNAQVENLLNMSRLESGNIQPRKDWCDINELAYTVINSLKENLKNQDVKISIDENIPLCKLDIGLMEQVLYNLLLNAGLYTPENCIIQVKAVFNDERLILIVEDNGNGFDAAEIDHVFEKFYRSKNVNKGGTGLGLSIVKGFIEAQNGTISLENKPTGGAKFTIQIQVETNYINHLKNE
jgi:two-component system sensor histidine kinase KdpD